jgi:hypothetical protein
MGRFLLVAGLAATLGACGSFDGTVTGDLNREVLGVAAPQPAGADTPVASDSATAADVWKTSQICTLGYDRLSEDVEPAELDRQLVDWQLRCKPYELSIFGVSLANQWPLTPWPY